ncbi:MAG: dihydrodipicolinate synthase family protein [Acholeplasmataceae bacterium]
MNYSKKDARLAAKEQFKGVWTAITTPFTPGLEIDEEGLKNNVRYVANTIGVKGIFCTGIMGEFWSLTNEERMRVIQIVVEEAKKYNVLTIAHTGDICAKDTIEMTRFAEEIGADFSVFIAPYFVTPNDQMTMEFFEYVSKEINIGYWIFDTPYTGRPLSAEFYKELEKKAVNFCGIKINRGMEQYLKLKEEIGKTILLSNPAEPTLLDLILNHGQQVYMSSPAPFLYQNANSHHMMEYARLAWEGKKAEAKVEYEKLTPMRNIHNKWIGKTWSEKNLLAVQYIKYWSELLGMAGVPVRSPYINMDENEKHALKLDLQSIGLIE